MKSQFEKLSLEKFKKLDNEATAKIYGGGNSAPTQMLTSVCTGSCNCADAGEKDADSAVVCS